MGGNGLEEPYNPLLDDHVLELARRNRGRERPRVCFVADRQRRLADLCRALLRGVRPPLGGLAPRPVRADGPRAGALRPRPGCHLRRWRQHGEHARRSGGSTGLDRILARAWDDGIVLAGTSAGANCWFECSTTDSFGPLAALHDGLAFLPGSHSPHYDGEPARRPLFQPPHRPGDACRTATRPTTAPRWSSAIATSSRPSRPCPAPGATASSADPTARRSKPSCRRATWAEPGASRPRRHPTSPIGRTACRTLDRRPGGAAPTPPTAPSRVGRDRAPGRPAARGRTAASRRAGWGTSRRFGGLDRVDAGVHRARVRGSARSLAGRARRRAGRGRSRAAPSAPGAGGRSRLSSRLSRPRSARAPAAASVPAGTSSATAALRNSGWSVTPTGAVAYSRETPRSRTPGNAASAATTAASVRLGVAEVGAQAHVGPHASFGHGSSLIGG